MSPYVDKIDADAVYTVRQLAELMGLAVSSVSGMAAYGWLPGSRMQPHGRGGRQRVWTGKQLRRLAGRAIKVAYDHEQFAPATLYRVGCGCPVCTAAHSVESRTRRRALSEKSFSAPQRKRLLELVSAGTPVAEAAAQVEVRVGLVFGRAEWDPGFADALDEAGWALCVLGEGAPGCGTAGGYRGNPSAKSSRPPCRGTGCRQWRRESSRVERSGRPVAG